MKVFSFRMKGRFAHFCKPYTNIYRLTQPCPTKTAIIGFIGSALGLEKDDLSLYSKIKCGVQISGKYKTVSMPYLIRKDFPGKTGNKQHSIVSVEVIINPDYRVYITGKDDIFFKLWEIISNQSPVFTPYLGVAQFIASTDYKVSEIMEGDILEKTDAEVKGAFIRNLHGELDFKKMKNYHLAEFEGLKGINKPRNFQHAFFAIELNGKAAPLKNVANILTIKEKEINVPIF